MNSISPPPATPTTEVKYFLARRVRASEAESNQMGRERASESGARFMAPMIITSS